MTLSLSENGQFLGVCWRSLPDTLQADWLGKTEIAGAMLLGEDRGGPGRTVWT